MAIIDIVYGRPAGLSMTNIKIVLIYLCNFNICCLFRRIDLLFSDAL